MLKLLTVNALDVIPKDPINTVNVKNPEAKVNNFYKFTKFVYKKLTDLQAIPTFFLHPF